MPTGSTPHILLIPPKAQDGLGTLDTGINREDMLRLLELKVHSRREFSKATICIRRWELFTKDETEEVPLYEYLNRRGQVMAHEILVRYDEPPIGSNASNAIFRVELKFR